MCDYVVKYCSLCHEIDNQSDHVPLVMALNIESETELMNVSKKIYTPRRIWNRTNREHINDYRMSLDDCLLSFTLPFDCLQCTDLVCTNNEHVESVQILHDNIISAMIDASVNIPSTKQNKKHKIPGWNENVQHSKVAIQPILTYCCSAINITHRSVKSLEKTQGILLKTALGLPKNRRNSPLFAACPWNRKDRSTHQETATHSIKKCTAG